MMLFLAICQLFFACFGPCACVVFEVIRSEFESSMFNYYSPVWLEETPATFCASSSTYENCLFQEYWTVFVDEIQVTLHEKMYSFSLPTEMQGRYTLRDLVLLEGGLELQLINDLDSSWEGSSVGFFNDGLFNYHDFGINFMQYSSVGSINAPNSRVRIGTRKSSNYPYAAELNAEGFGIDVSNSRYQLSSGIYSETAGSVFASGTVFVNGSTTRAAGASNLVFERIYQSLAPGGHSTAIPGLEYATDDGSLTSPSSLLPITDNDYSILLWLRLHRGSSGSPARILINSDSIYTSNPGIFIGTDGLTSDESPALDRSRQLGFTIYTISGLLGFDTQVTLTPGMWHQICLVRSGLYVTMFVDGYPQHTSLLTEDLYYPAIDSTLHLMGSGPSAGEEAASFDISDVRVYTDQMLSGQELTWLHQNWMSHHLTCGDGLLSPNEDCDDGNSNDLDGCSSLCVVEVGFYCFSSTMPASHWMEYGDGVDDAYDVDRPRSPSLTSQCESGLSLRAKYDPDTGVTPYEFDLVSMVMTDASPTTWSNLEFSVINSPLPACTDELNFVDCYLASGCNDLFGWNAFDVTTSLIIHFTGLGSHDVVEVNGSFIMGHESASPSSVGIVFEADDNEVFFWHSSNVFDWKYANTIGDLCGTGDMDVGDEFVFAFHHNSSVLNLKLRFAQDTPASAMKVAIENLVITTGLSKSPLIYQGIKDGFVTFSSSVASSRRSSAMGTEQYNLMERIVGLDDPMSAFDVISTSSSIALEWKSDLIFLDDEYRYWLSNYLFLPIHGTTGTRAVASFWLNIVESGSNQMFSVTAVQASNWATDFRKSRIENCLSRSQQSFPNTYDEFWESENVNQGSDDSCSNIYFYRICFRAFSELGESGVEFPTDVCDEKIYLPQGSWQKLSFKPVEKIIEKYMILGGSPSFTGSHFLQFAMFNLNNGGRNSKIWLDDIEVVDGPVPGSEIGICPSLRVVATSSDSLSSVEFFSNDTIVGVSPSSVFALIEVDPATYAAGSTHHCVDSACLREVIFAAEFGTIIMLGGTGVIGSLCADYDCLTALKRIGLDSMAFPFSHVENNLRLSFSLIGFVGSHSAVSIDINTDSTNATTTAEIGGYCHEYSQIIKETSRDGVSVSPPLRDLSDATSSEYYLADSFHGFEEIHLGDLYNMMAASDYMFLELGETYYLFHSPGHCARMCEELGFTLASVNVETCQCADLTPTDFCVYSNQMTPFDVGSCLDDFAAIGTMKDTGEFCYGDFRTHACRDLTDDAEERAFTFFRTSSSRYVLPSEITVNCLNPSATPCSLSYDGKMTTYESLSSNSMLDNINITLLAPTYLTGVKIYWIEKKEDYSNENLVVEVFDIYYLVDASATWALAASFNETADRKIFDDTMLDEGGQYIDFVALPSTSKISEVSIIFRSGLQASSYVAIYDVSLIALDNGTSVVYDKYNNNNLTDPLYSINPTMSTSSKFVDGSSEVSRRSAAPVFLVDDYFHIDRLTGELFSSGVIFNSIVQSFYKITIVENFKVFSVSDTINVGDSATSYTHSLGSFPLWINVLVTFNASGAIYRTHATGTAFFDGEYQSESHGGVLYGVTATSITIMPSLSVNYGSIFSVHDGWTPVSGTSFSATSATVDIEASLGSTPDFDSGWFSMSSSNPTESRVPVKHNLGSLDYAFVKVYYYDAADSQTWYEAAGSPLSASDMNYYGGLSYGYNATHVVIFAPAGAYYCLNNKKVTDVGMSGQTCSVCGGDDSCDNPRGRAMLYPSTYFTGMTHNHDVKVRVIVWLPRLDFSPLSSTDVTVNAHTSTSYATAANPSSSLPTYFKTFISADMTTGSDLRFQAYPSCTGSYANKYFGSVATAISVDYVHAWAPYQAVPRKKYLSNAVSVLSAWGNSEQVITSSSATVRYVVFDGAPNKRLKDWTTVNLQVESSMSDIPFSVEYSPSITLPDSYENGFIVTTLLVHQTEQQLQNYPIVDTVTFLIIGGNTGNVFDVDAFGNVFVDDEDLLDLTAIPEFRLRLLVNCSNPRLVEEVQITMTLVDVDEAPIIEGSLIRQIIEDSSENLPVGDPVNGIDPDGTNDLFYELLGGNDGDAFYIDACDGQIRVLTPSALDFEGQTGYDHFYLIIRITENSATALNSTFNISVFVTNLNEEPVWNITAAQSEISIFENLNKGEVIGSLGGFCIDYDQNDQVKYSIVSAIHVATTLQSLTFFSIVNTTGELSIGANGDMNYEAGADYEVYVRCTDYVTSGFQTPPNLFAETLIYITLIDQNDPPEFMESSYSFLIAESASEGDLVGHLLCNDEDGTDLISSVYNDSFTVEDPPFSNVPFYVDSNCDLRVNNSIVSSLKSINYESGITVYSLIVFVNDSGLMNSGPSQAPLTASVALYVSISDTNEAPFLIPPSTTTVFHLEENSLTGSLVAILNASDPDIFSMPLQQVGFDIIGPYAMLNLLQPVLIDDFSAKLIVSAEIDYESLFPLLGNNFQIELRIFDIGGSYGSAEVNSNNITLNLTDMNDAPMLTCPSNPFCQIFTIPENSPNLTIVSSLFGYTDQDNDMVNFLLQSTVGVDPEEDGTQFFKINLTSGDVYLHYNSSSDNLDYESDSTVFLIDIVIYDVNVLKGPGSLNSYETFQIFVSNENEPVLYDCTDDIQFAVPETALNSTFVASLAPIDCIFDPEGDVISFSVSVSAFMDGFASSGWVMNPFSVSSDGAVTLANNTLLGNANTSYRMTILADDGTGTTPFNLTVIESSANHVPVFVNLTLVCTVSEHMTTFTPFCNIRATDQDDDSLTYSLSILSNTFSMSTQYNPIGDYEYGALQLSIPLDYETQFMYNFVSVVSDDYGGGFFSLSGSKALSIIVVDKNDAPMAILEETTMVALESLDITVVLGIIEFFDPDSNDAFTFQTSLSDMFTCVEISPVGSTQRCELTLTSTLDFETDMSHAFDVTMFDFDMASDFTSVEINVLDFNEDPIFAAAIDDFFTVDEGSDNAYLSASYGNTSFFSVDMVMYDYDASNVSLVLTIDNAPFDSMFDVVLVSQTSVSATFRLQLAGTAVDFEDVPMYSGMILSVSDGTNIVSRVFSVVVTNLNDVTISGVSLLSDINGGYIPFNLNGGEKVVIDGTNLGANYQTLSDGSENDFLVTYGQNFDTYTAYACNQTVAGVNTQIVCWTAKGSGIRHRWMITVNSHITNWNHIVYADNSIRTKYFSPYIDSFAITTPANRILVNGNPFSGNDDEVVTGIIRNEGGDILSILGTNLGVSASVPQASQNREFGGLVSKSEVAGEIFIQDAMSLFSCMAGLSMYLSAVGDHITLHCTSCESSADVIVEELYAFDGVTSLSESNFESAVAFQPCALDIEASTEEYGWQTVLDDEMTGFEFDSYISSAEPIILPSVSLRIRGVTVADSNMLDSWSDSETLELHVSSESPKVFVVSYNSSCESNPSSCATLINSNSWSPSSADTPPKFIGIPLEGHSLIATNCIVTDDNFALECLVPPGLGQNLRVYTVNGCLPSSRSASVFDYASPEILTLYTSQNMFHLDTKGEDPIFGQPSVFISGVSFGGYRTQFAGIGIGSVVYGPNFEAICELDDVVDDGEVTIISPLNSSLSVSVSIRTIACFHVAGVGSNHSWTVEVAAKSSVSTNLTSYMPPKIALMPKSWPFFSTEGGDNVVLKGYGFGPVSLTVEQEIYRDLNAIFGRKAEQIETGLHFETVSGSCNVNVDDISILCTIGPGTGFNHSWQLSVAEQNSNVFDAFSSYLSPMISDFTVNDTLVTSGLYPEDVNSYSTRGQQKITIQGRNFGRVSQLGSYFAPVSAVLTYQEATISQQGVNFTYVGCNVTIDHSVIECWTTVGVGNFLSWTLLVDFQTNIPQSTSYAPPEITNITRDDSLYSDISDGLYTTGGGKIVLWGKNFGSDSETIEKVTIGPSIGVEQYVLHDIESDIQCEIMTPHTAIICTAPKGVGMNLIVIVYIDGQTNSATAENQPKLSFKSPIISSVSPSEVSTNGGKLVTVKGSNFGPFGESEFCFGGVKMEPMTTILTSSSDPSIYYQYVDDNEFRFISFDAQGINFAVQIIQKNVFCTGSCTQASNILYLSYGFPVISSKSVIPLQSGEVVLVLRGTNFGTNPSFIWPHDSFDIAVTSSLPFYGSNNVFLYEFLNETTFPNPTVDDLSSDMYLETCHNFTVWDHETIQCTSPYTAGSILVNISGLVSNVIVYEQLSPAIQEIVPHSTSISTEGGTKINITGKNFGTSLGDFTPVFFLRQLTPNPIFDDDSSFDPIVWMSDTVCELVKFAFVNIAENIATIVCEIPQGCGKFVTMKLESFTGTDASFYTEGDDCYPCISYDSPVYDTVVAEESSGSLIVRDQNVFIGRSLQATDSIYVPTYGSVVKLTGNNFGWPGAVRGAIIVSEDCAQTPTTVLISNISSIVQNHTHISLTIPDGIGSGYQLYLQSANQDPHCVNVSFTSPIAQSVSLSPPLSFTDIPTVGGTRLVIIGSNFGIPSSNDFSSSIHNDGETLRLETLGLATYLNGEDDGYVTVDKIDIGTKRLYLESWNHSMIVGIIPDGEGQDLPIRVYLGSGGGKGSPVFAESVQQFSYSPPTLSDIFPIIGPTNSVVLSGNLSADVYVTITGKNFGSNSASRVLHFGYNGQTETDTVATLSNSDFEIANHTHIIFKLPNGQGENHTVVLEVAGQISVNALHFSYVPPSIDSISPISGPTSACLLYQSISNWKKEKALSNDPSSVFRKCEDKLLLIIEGQNFGEGSLTVVAGSQRCVLDDNDVYVDGDWNCVDCDNFNVITGEGSELDQDLNSMQRCLHKHTHIVIRAPSSFGTTGIVLSVSDQQNSIVPIYSFFPPTISRSIPGSTRGGDDPIDSKGSEEIVISGENFGGISSVVQVTFDSSGSDASNIECQFAKWNQASTTIGDGQPYITCFLQDRIVAGGHNVTIQVAGQTILAPSTYDPSEGLFYSWCLSEVDQTYHPVYYYALVPFKEHCLECPLGANCTAVSEDTVVADGFDPLFQDPSAVAYFWLTYHDVNSQDASDRCLAERLPPLSNRKQCPDYVGCSPPESCLGNNQCKNGYEYLLKECDSKWAGTTTEGRQCVVDDDCSGGVSCDWKKPEACAECLRNRVDDAFGECTCVPFERCAYCTVFEYFRINGECEPCPKNVWVLIGLFIAAIFLFGLLGYILNKKRFNLAFISIGFDYFQILAVFASSDVPWPGAIIALLRILEFFSFNIDITAPECVMPDFTYELKWILTVTLPLMAGGLFLIMHVFYMLQRVIINGERGWTKVNSHYTLLVAMFTVMLYYLYLPLTRKILDIFNCNPIIPDDGYTYTDWTSVNCNDGLCRCWQKGEPQMILFPWALLFFLIFSLGFPLWAAFVIVANKRLLKEDQLLRAMDLGDTRATNPSAFDLRQKYHKLYYHFKPEKIYWILILISRKFWIALAALMFRNNPTFQLSFILLILFVSFVLQNKHKPYMSSVEREKELDLYKKKVELEMRRIEKARQFGVKYEPDRTYLIIAQHLNVIERQQESSKRRRRMKRLVENGEVNITAEDMVQDIKEYFWDYNTVETVLLTCAILICISGVMFESEDSSNGISIESYFDILAGIVIFIIVFSLAYYFTVFFSEVFTVFGLEKSKWVRVFMSVKAQELKKITDDLKDYEMAAVGVEDILKKRTEVAERMKSSHNKTLQEVLEEQMRLRDHLQNLDQLLEKYRSMSSDIVQRGSLGTSERSLGTSERSLGSSERSLGGSNRKIVRPTARSVVALDITRPTEISELEDFNIPPPPIDMPVLSNKPSVDRTSLKSEALAQAMLSRLQETRTDFDAEKPKPKKVMKAKKKSIHEPSLTASSPGGAGVLESSDVASSPRDGDVLGEKEVPTATQPTRRAGAKKVVKKKKEIVHAEAAKEEL